MKRAIVLLAAVAVFLLATATLSAAVGRNGRDFDPPRSSGSGIRADPDVCRTPSPGPAVPIPYVNQGGSQGISKDFPVRSAPKASSSGNRDRRPYER